MDDTNRDLVSLISVILLLIIRQSSINITVLQFLQEDAEEGAFDYATCKVCRRCIYIYELVTNLLAGLEELGYFHDHSITAVVDSLRPSLVSCCK